MTFPENPHKTKRIAQRILEDAQKRYPGKNIVLENSVEIIIDVPKDVKYEMGVSENSESAILRPFRVLVSESRNVGSVNHILYKDKNTSKCFVVGSLVYTFYASKGKRLIFFPGTRHRKLALHSRVGNLKGKNYILDHITLEPDQTWHYTILTYGKKPKQRLPPNPLYTFQSKKLFFWFSFSIKSPTLLEPLCEKYKFQLKTSGRELEKHFSILNGANRKKEPHLLHQPESEACQNEFINFSFWIDKRFLGRYRRFPKKSIVLPSQPPSSTLFSTLNSRIKVRGLNGKIVVITSKHSNNLPSNMDIVI